MKIATLVFGGGISTLGIDVIKGTIEQDFNDVIITECRPSDISALKDADIIMTSIYWFDNLLDYLNFLVKAGINPKAKKPMLVIGGMAVNTRILHGYFHYAVLGDGEMVISDFIRAVKDGSDPGQLPGVIADGDFDTHKEYLTNPIIPARAYVELRDNRTARIEIARGCRFKCPFCQIAHVKPYREQEIEVIEHILKGTPTKSVGLFAPDRTGYSNYSRLEAICKKLGKHNTAEDTRLDQLMKYKVASKVKFGVEGFTEATRKSFRKIKTNEELIAGFNHVFNVVKTPKGKRMTTATVYMIGDLPGETVESMDEFWEVFAKIDKLCPGKFTMFLTLNSFTPKPFTPMERAGIHPWNDWYEAWNNRPRFQNVTIAGRGGVVGPSNRIAHMMTIRGDERLTKALFYLANDGRKIIKSRGEKAGEAICKLIKMSGVDPESLWAPVPESTKMVHEQFSIQKIKKREK